MTADYIGGRLTFEFEKASVEKLCGKTEQVMVYGWRHCYLYQVQDALSQRFKMIFDHQVGEKEIEHETVEGTKIKQIKPDTEEKNIQRVCKSGLTSIIFENYKRMKEGKEIIPILFCVDMDYNPYESTSETVTSKDDKYNKLVTNKELRRCYKLFTSEIKDIADAAQQTVKFVKIVQTGKRKYKFEEQKPLWENKDWKNHWEARKKLSNTDVKLEKSWQKELQELGEEYSQRSQKETEQK